MNAVFSAVSGFFETPLMHNSAFVLFSVIALGLLLGRITIGGIHLGTAGVMFVALIYGHYGVELSPAVTTVGLVVFVYCVGIGAGSRFFTTLKQSGTKLAVISCAVIGVGGLATALTAGALSISPSVAAGVFAGALTSTPGLAAAQEYYVDSANQGLVSAGYAIAYPFGVVGTVLFVQLWPRLRRKDLQKIGERLEAEEAEGRRIGTAVFRMTNPRFEGKRIEDLRILEHLRCRITRTMRDGILVPLEQDETLKKDQVLWVVGYEDQIEALIDMFGERTEAPVVINSDMERRSLVVTNSRFANKTFAEIRTLKNHGVSVSRIKRYEYEIVPTETTEIHIGDVLVVVGCSENLEKFSKAVGHRASLINATDLLSLTLGMALGVWVGTLSFGGFKLGMAGGPLLVALLLGHFGRVGVVAGYVPRPTRVMLRELGLCFFLAGAGIKGGAGFVETLQSQGAGIFAVGVVATLAPIVVGYMVATLVYKFDILTALGGVCGAMTSTPALGVISSKTDAQAPVLSYASAYPAALLLIVVAINSLIAAMS